MLNMIKGCRIHDPSMLFEGYEQTEFGFVANVNADKIKSLLESFVLLHNEPCFVIIEVPTNGNVESTLTTDSIHTLHKDIYYMDGLSPERAIDFLHVFLVFHLIQFHYQINLPRLICHLHFFP